MSREYTKILYGMIEDGFLTDKSVVEACMSYMSESDVEDMMRSNEFIMDEDYEEDE